MAETHSECSTYITQVDIDKLKKRIKIGDKLLVRTLKAADSESMSSRYYGIERKAVVVGKYSSFVVVEFSNGTQEAFLWTDLLKGRKKK